MTAATASCRVQPVHAAPQLQIDLLLCDGDVATPRPLACTFTASLNRRLDGPGFGGDLLTRAGWHVLAFKSTADDWFQSIDEAALAAVDAALAPLALTLTLRASYGSSMGGHAAIVFARRLGCTRVLALSPQFCIDDPADRRWAARAASIRWRWRITPDSLPAGAQCIVVHDNRSVDAWHVRQLQTTLGIDRVVPLPVRHAGHPVSHALTEAGLIRQLALDVLTTGTVPHIDLRPQRWRSAAYLGGLAERLASHRRTAVALRMLALGLQRAPAHIHGPLLRQRSALLSAAGRHDEAAADAAAGVAAWLGDPGMLAHQSQMLAAGGRLDEALTAIDAAITIDPMLPAYHLDRLGLLLRLRRWRALRHSLRQALALTGPVRHPGRLWHSQHLRQLLRQWWRG